jgi:hypothetical protein
MGSLWADYKVSALSAQAEYVFNIHDRTASFFYTWDELIYTPADRSRFTYSMRAGPVLTLVLAFNFRL